MCYIYFTRIIAILLKVTMPFQWQWCYEVRLQRRSDFNLFKRTCLYKVKHPVLLSDLAMTKQNVLDVFQDHVCNCIIFLLSQWYRWKEEKFQATLTKSDNLANPVNIKTDNSTGTGCMFKWPVATHQKSIFILVGKKTIHFYFLFFLILTFFYM